MGCTASKSLEMQARMDGWSPPLHTKSFARSFSMPLRKSVQQSPARKQEQELHIVALTSSTYGVLRIPDDEEQEEEQEEASRPTIDFCGKSGPISSEAPNSQQKSEVKGDQILASVPEAEVIDLWELMKDLDEENGREEKSGASIDQLRGARNGKNRRMLSRSISSVDSIRELDVKIRSVALALPDLEKKLLALEALNSISKEDHHHHHHHHLFLPSPSSFHSFGKNNNRQISAAKLRPAKSMKGLFYGATIEDLRKANHQENKELSSSSTIAHSSSTLSSCSSSSSSSCSSSAGGSASSSYDASSSGDSEEILFDPEVLKSFKEEESHEEEEEEEEGKKNRDDDSSSSCNNNNNNNNKSAIMKKKKMMRSSKVSAIEVEEQKLASKNLGRQQQLLDSYPAMCPPRGEERVVIYVTSLRGIRKTFEDCGRMKMILQGLGVAIDERDVSMHAEFRHELNDLLKTIINVDKSNSSSSSSNSNNNISVPRLFVRGRYIGGVDEVAQMNEEGAIAKLVEGMERKKKQGDDDDDDACGGCGGVRFVPCFECSGSCKVVVFGGGVGDYSGSGVVVRCSDCNENGLIRCPVCL